MSDNLRAALDAAYEEVVNDVPPTEPQVTEIPPADKVEEPEGSAPYVPSDQPIEPEIEAPIHWASEDREVFKALDKRGKDILLRRHKEMEAGYTKKLQAHSEDVKIAENYRKMINPHEGYIKQIGIDPREAFEKLIGAEIKLRTGSPQEKAALIQNLAKQYGVQFEQGETQPEIDPQIQAIFQKLQKQEQTLLQIQQEKEEAEKRVLLSQINNFSTEKDEKGGLKYPHFETLKAEMGFLLEHGRAVSMEDAYKKALRLNEDLHNTDNLRQNRDTEPKRKTLDSKNASFNVKSEVSAKLSEPTKNLSLREQLAQAMDAQSNKKRI